MKIKNILVCLSVFGLGLNAFAQNKPATPSDSGKAINKSDHRPNHQFQGPGYSLVLNGAALVLNGNPANPMYVTINQPSPSGIVAMGNGKVINTSGQFNYILWDMAADTGSYVFPFATYITRKSIPFTFHKTAATGGLVAVSTWATNQQNLPHPLAGIANSQATVTNMTGFADSLKYAVDRFWDIEVSAPTAADITLSYAGTENTTVDPANFLRPFSWNGSAWVKTSNTGAGGVTKGVASIGPILGQTSFTPLVLLESPLLQATTSTVPTACYGGCSGSATVTATGGTGPLTYYWLPGYQSSATASGLCAGTYTCIVTDSLNDTISPVVTITQPVAIRDSVVSVTGVSCYGDNNGSATIGVTGGTGGYNYQWNDPSTQTTPTAINLSGGSYTCAVTDANGCQPPNLIVFNVMQPQVLSVTTANTSTICAGNSATLVASAGGGTQPYSYNWIPINLNGSTQQIQPPSTNTYTVNVTDNNGCTASNVQTIVVNALPTINMYGNSMFCAGSSDTLSVTAAGSGPFTYSWNTGSTKDTITVTSANLYIVYISDGNGCSNNATISVIKNDLPQVVFAVGNTTICNGSSTTLTALGGSGTTYNWIGGPSTASYTVSPTSTTAYTVTATSSQGCSASASEQVIVNNPGIITANAFPSNSICAGNSLVLYGTGGTAYTWSNGVNNGQSFNPSGTVTYTVTSISNGCTAQDTITVGVNPLPTITITTSPKDSICQGGNVTLTASGASSYIWTNGVTNGIAFSPATSDVYVVTATDTHGCENSKQQSIIVNNLPSIDGTVSPQTVCQGGNVTLSGNGGSTYTWTGGVTNGVAFIPASSGSYTVTGTNAAGCSNTAVVGVTINPIPVIGDSAIPSTSVCAGNPVALLGKGGSSYSWSGGIVNGISFVPTVSGTYTVTGYGANGCTAKDSISIKVNNKVILTPVADNTTCGSNNGAVKVTANSGTPPYSYSWSTTPVNTTDSIGALSPGTYIITVNDVNKCSSYASINIASSTSPILSISSSSSSCGNASGTATVGVVGGTPPYRYNWSNGDTTSYANNLTIGTYIVTVNDLNHCSSFASAEISNLDGPSISTNAVSNVNCNGQATGAILISVSGGAPPYNFVWSNGQTSQNLSSLSAGPYQVTVTDGNNCSALGNYTITQPLALTMFKSIVKANCGVADGEASVTVSGGTPPYSYIWNNGRTNDSIQNENAGSYHITVIDHNGCEIDSAQVSISNINGPVVSIAISGSASCNGGGVTLTGNVTGGSLPYSYMWSTGSTATSINHIPAGSYNVNVTDHLGCVGVADTSVYEVPPPVAPICLVSVDSATQKNMVIWNKYQSSGIASYNIYRETTQAGVYQKIANVPYNNLSTYIDNFANPQTRSWRYELSQVDSCGNESALSPDNKTMHLTVNKGIGGINLIWDNYEGIVFYSYYVYRDTAGGVETKIDSIPNNIFTYTDTKPPANLDSLTYRIQIINPDPCIPSFGLRPMAVNYNSSKSNSGNYSYNVGVGMATITNPTGKLTVYPNPNTGAFTFTLTEAKGSKSLKLSIVNELGQVITTDTYTDVPATFTKQMDLSSLAKGVYFLKTESGQATHYNKVVIQ